MRIRPRQHADYDLYERSELIHRLQFLMHNEIQSGDKVRAIQDSLIYIDGEAVGKIEQDQRHIIDQIKGKLCTVEGTEGWLPLGNFKRAVPTTDRPTEYSLVDMSTKKLVRKFTDTNGDKKLDNWIYFKDGVETYRDIDTDCDGRADQCRFMDGDEVGVLRY